MVDRAAASRVRRCAPRQAIHACDGGVLRRDTRVRAPEGWLDVMPVVCERAEGSLVVRPEGERGEG